MLSNTRVIGEKRVVAKKQELDIIFTPGQSISQAESGVECNPVQMVNKENCKAQFKMIMLS